ncbi:MAG: RNA polymerase sigma factor [Deltaproteobacteria bacterium]|nr:RNA polymerase sigma factor [Deltaproteobacteria bacterium]
MKKPIVPITSLSNTDSVDDATLVLRMKEGDVWAMEAFYHRFVHKITGISARLLRNSSDIEDVVQDTFTEAYRDMPQIKSPQLVERWLVRIAVHRAHRRFRRRKLKRTLGLDRSIDDERLFIQVGVHASHEARAEIALLDSVFDTMNISERTCFVLRYIEGYRLEEVAQITGYSLATVKRRIVNAKGAVDRHFEEESHG